MYSDNWHAYFKKTFKITELSYMSLDEIISLTKSVRSEILEMIKGYPKLLFRTIVSKILQIRVMNRDNNGKLRKHMGNIILKVYFYPNKSDRKKQNKY